MKNLSLLLRVRALAIGVCCAMSSAQLFAADAPARPPAQAVPQGYRLCPHDSIEVSIFDEPDLLAPRTIDSSGEVDLPLVNGPVPLAGKTLREAEALIEKLYVDQKILKHPAASIRIVEYAPREVEVTGEVNNQGMLQFPKERTSLDLTEVIARCGGFTQSAKRSSVQILHITPDGKETSSVVNYDDLRKPGRDRVVIYPGDKIRVPAIIF